jgi:small subunit ribosomal protein S1
METNNEMERLYAETFQRIEEGGIRSGKIVAIKQDSVIVDIGYKTEGVIRIEEFSEEELRSMKPGDKIEVYVITMRDSEGAISLSKDRASKMKIWDVLEKAAQEGTPVAD